MSEKVEKTVIEQIEALKETDEFKTLITNSNKKYWDDNVGAKVKETYGNVDKVILEVLGIEKDAGVFTSVQLKGILEKYKGLEAKLKENKGGGLKVEESQEYKLLLDKSNHTSKALEVSQIENKSLKGNQSRMKIDTSISNELSGREFNATYGKEELAELLGIRKAKLTANASILEDGSIVYYKDSEKTELYRNTLQNPMTIKEVAEVVFGSLFKTTKKGGNSPTTTQEVAEGKAITLDMSGIKSKADFYAKFNEVMAPKGMASHEKEFLEIQRATSTHYKIEALPLN